MTKGAHRALVAVGIATALGLVLSIVHDAAAPPAAAAVSPSSLEPLPPALVEPEPPGAGSGDVDESDVDVRDRRPVYVNVPNLDLPGHRPHVRHLVPHIHRRHHW